MLHKWHGLFTLGKVISAARYVPGPWTVTLYVWLVQPMAGHVQLRIKYVRRE